MQARNFWAAAPPKVSVLHYDWQDSILLQLSGTKKFTIVDPARLPASYPCVQLMTQLVRRAPGVFDARETERELDNFPLVNVTHPDLARHPLFRDALEQRVFGGGARGAALLLPAYWHHQVDVAAPASSVAVATVPGPLARDAPLPYAARERLHQLHPDGLRPRRAGPLPVSSRFNASR